MTVLDVLRPLASSNAQQRAWDYVERVVIRDGTVNAIAARVQGTSLYDTSIRFDGQTLRVWCTCPFFSDQGSACKHLWAVAVVANEHAWLTDLPAGLRVVMDFKDLEEHELAAPRTHGVPAYPQFPPRPAPPAWASALAAVTPRHEEAWVAARESQLLFVVVVPAFATVTELPLHVEVQNRKKNGGWSKPRPAQLTLDTIAHLPDDDERWALSLLQGSSNYPRLAGSYGHGFAPFGAFYLKASMVDLLLPRLGATGRVRLRQSPANNDVTLSCQTGDPWRLRLVITRVESELQPGYRVNAVLERGDMREDIQRFSVLTDSIAILDGVVSPFDPAGGFTWAAELRTRGSFVVPARSSRELVAALARSPIEQVEQPEELQWEERVVEPRFVATIGKPDPDGGLCAVDAAVEYDGIVAPIDGSVRLVSDNERVMYRRDQGAEREALATLKRHGVADIGAFIRQRPAIHARKVPALVHALIGEGWRVEAEGFRYRAIDAPRLHISSGIDWFQIEAAGDVDQTVDLPDLVKAIAEGRRTVTLGDGTQGMLPEKWLARVAPVLALGEVSGATVRFKPSQVALIDALLAAQPAVDWDEGFARARDALKRFEGVHPEDPPPTFHGTLRDYQRESLGWMRFLRDFGFGGCLADDMGLGKTVMVLAMLEAQRLDPSRPHRPSLIVLPRSLLFNWMSEAARFTPGLRVLDFAHADRHHAADAIGESDLVLTTYGTLRRDVPVLKDHRFDYVVLDEAQAIKNAATATAKAVRLLKADHRLALTGTPVENHLGELYSLFDFLNAGMMGRIKDRGPSAFAKAKADKKGPRHLRQEEDADAREHLARLANGLRPFFLRRTKDQVAPELPSRTEETLYCELEGEQRRVYHELRDHYRRVLLHKITRDGMAKSKMQILEALLRLRQAACHTGLLPRGDRGPEAPRYMIRDESAKFDLLLPRLDEVIDEGRKALVFSQFTSLLALLRKRLDASGITYEYLDGATRDRAAHVERFQQDASCPLFLISLKAGGTGLNLTAAEYVFLLDPWWNPAVEMQAIDRTHRIGQTKPVFAYRLVARETVEERILELQSHKRALADAILDAGAGGLRGLEREDLEALLS